MSFKDQINKFVGKVRISDIENAFNFIIDNVNAFIDTINNGSEFLEDTDNFYLGSTSIPAGNYTLTLGALKKILTAYDKEVIGGTVVKNPLNTGRAILFPSLEISKDNGITQVMQTEIDKPSQADIETNSEVGKVVGYDTTTDEITNQNNVIVSPSGIVDTATEISSDNFMIQYGNDSIPWTLQENEYYSFIREYLNEYTPSYTYGNYFCGMGVSNSKYTPFVREVEIPIPRIICSLNSNKCGMYPSSLSADFKVVNSDGEVLHSYNLSESFDENTIIQNDYRVTIVDEYTQITYTGDSTSYGYFGISVRDSQNHYIVVNEIELFLLPYSSTYSSLEGNKTLGFQNLSPLLLTPMHRTRITQYSPGGTTILPSGQTNPDIIKIADIDWNRDEWVMNTTDDWLYVNPEQSPLISLTVQNPPRGSAVNPDDTKPQFIVPRRYGTYAGERGDYVGGLVRLADGSNIIDNNYTNWSKSRNRAIDFVFAPVWVPKGMASTIFPVYGCSIAQYYTLS